MTQQTCITKFIRDDLNAYRKTAMLPVEQILSPTKVAQDKIKADALRTLIGEIERSCQRERIAGERRQDPVQDFVVHSQMGNYKDDDVYAVIRRVAKSWRETLAAKPDPELSLQIETIEEYLPMQLSEDHLYVIAQDFPEFPLFMRHLKVNYPSRYDGKQAKTIHELVNKKNV